MEKQWCYFMFLLWLSYLMVSSVLMFTRGFLLTRMEQNDYSTCSPYMDIPCSPHGASHVNITNGNIYQCSQDDKFRSLLHDMNTTSKICLPPKAKLVVIVLDALRYEFMRYDESRPNPQPYHNKLPIFNTLLERAPQRTRSYKFLADAPTTTLQRLKALTTGSLPTFIDAGSNFASHNISEDNVIDQMRRHRKRMVFIGDNIWDSIYPDRFDVHYSYDGLNTWDLDTVDYGVYEHLVPEIRQAQWDMMIVHLAGVDHAGHRYGPYHPEMERKLNEMNTAIESVVDALEDDMLLYVVSDHGSTKTGDHGGESDLETEAAMFVYSPSANLVAANLVEGTDTIKQVDLVPTMATVLGVPIPFSNLGSIIFDAIPVANRSKAPYTDWQEALLTLWTNVQQITTYIEQYSKTTDQFNQERLEMLDLKYKQLLFKVHSVVNEHTLKLFMHDAKLYIKMARQMCEEVWVQFDSFSMSRGLLLMFLTIFFAYMIVDGIPSQRLPEIFMSSFLVCSYAVMAIAAVASVVCFYLNFVENLELTLFFSTGMASIFMLSMLVIQNWELIAIHWYDCNKSRDWIGISCRVIVLLSISGLFSNSYIIEEGTVLQFLSLTLVWILVYNVGHKYMPSNKVKNVFSWFKSQWTPTKIKLIFLGLIVSVFVRSCQFFWRCREEQSQWCESGMVIDKDTQRNAKSATRLETILTLIGLAFFVTVTRIWLRSCGNLVGFSPTVTITRYMPSVIVVCTGGYWVLHDLPKETKSKIIASWQIDMFAWIIYGVVAIAFISIVIQPLCVYIIPRKKEKLSVYGRENIIPQLFNHVKGLYKDKNVANGEDMPIVCGLGTVYSAVYVVFSVFMLLLFALLLGDKIAPAAVIMYTTAAVILAILSVAHYEKVTNIAQLFDVSGTSIFCWVLLCQYFFYGTGHQPTFPNIHWSAAFIGTGGNFAHNSIPGLLIIINTFGPHMIFGLTVPLLLIAPFTLYVMFPNLPMFKSEDRKEMKRGELMLYERDEMLLSGVFIVCCKYMLFFGIRMFVCMLASTIHCRHLMVWKVFAPKLIFEGLGLFVTLPAVLFGYMLLVRTNSRVDSLITSLDKQGR